MNILLSNSWLRDFLKTTATPAQIQKYLSLCGPSVEKIEKGQNDSVYSIEVTTNRIDTVGVYGIAREAAAILPRFDTAASIKAIKLSNLNFKSDVDYLKAVVDKNLCPRFTAALIKKVLIKQSPAWMKDRLTAVGVRPINNVVDISNYIMHELGQPVHTFDYDKIIGAKMILRASRKGEVLTTLDGKKHLLPGGDIVIEDGSGRLIDLAGIMGGENSAVDEKTKNVLLFIQTYNPVNIRKTSMALAQRTEAAEIFEKGLDPELVAPTMSRGLELFIKYTGGAPRKEILDIYPNPYRPKFILTSLEFINDRLGTTLSKKEISEYLKPLGFECRWKNNQLSVSVPSFRAPDMTIPEDIVEEIARIYGYHNLPSRLMGGIIPEPLVDSPFSFEKTVKDLIKGYGGVEVYTLSLVSKEFAGAGALKLRNPLGKESEYLRTQLMPSLVSAAKGNSGEKEPFHLFEMANVYLPRKGDLPEEKLTLAGILSGYSFREAKGVVEGLLNQLNITNDFIPEDTHMFLPSQGLKISASGKDLGVFGTLPQKSLIYYEFAVEGLRGASKEFSAYRQQPKYPAQIEDTTFVLPSRTKVGEVIDSITHISQHITQIELRNVYKDAYTFRIQYQNPNKTLTDKEVEEIREKITSEVKKRFGGTVK